MPVTAAKLLRHADNRRYFSTKNRRFCNFFCRSTVIVENFSQIFDLRKYFVWPVALVVDDSAWRFGFLAKQILGFLRLLANVLVIILCEICKILQAFSKSWKQPKKSNFWQEFTEIKDLGKKTKRLSTGLIEVLLL